MFYVRTNDGVKIAVYDLNPTAAETVFLVHGWPLSVSYTHLTLPTKA